MDVAGAYTMQLTCRTGLLRSPYQIDTDPVQEIDLEMVEKIGARKAVVIRGQSVDLQLLSKQFGITDARQLQQIVRLLQTTAGRFASTEFLDRRTGKPRAFGCVPSPDGLFLFEAGETSDSPAANAGYKILTPKLLDVSKTVGYASGSIPNTASTIFGLRIDILAVLTAIAMSVMVMSGLRVSLGVSTGLVASFVLLRQGGNRKHATFERVAFWGAGLILLFETVALLSITSLSR
jgi:hypothetical protein